MLGDEEESTTLFTSSLALPLLFASHADLSELSLDSASSALLLLNEYFRGATGDGSISLYDELPPLNVFGTKPNLNVEGYTVYDGNRVRFKVTAVSDAPIYLSLSTEYPRKSTVSVTANGTTVSYPLYAGSDAEHDVTVPLGSFDANTVVEVSINFPDSSDGRFYIPENANLLWQENSSAARQAIERLQSRSATDLRISGDSLSATIVTASGETTLQTTLPADFGFTVKVDGKRVETVSALGEFLAIPISGEGEHRITLTLNDPLETAPALLSALGALLLAAAAVLELLVCKGRITLPYLSEKKRSSDTEVDEA